MVARAYRNLGNFSRCTRGYSSPPSPRVHVDLRLMGHPDKNRSCTPLASLCAVINRVFGVSFTGDVIVCYEARRPPSDPHLISSSPRQVAHRCRGGGVRIQRPQQNHRQSCHQEIAIVIMMLKFMSQFIKTGYHSGHFV